MKNLSLKSIILILMSPVLYFLIDKLAIYLTLCLALIINFLLSLKYPLGIELYSMSGRLTDVVTFYIPSIRITYAIITTAILIEIIKYLNYKNKNKGATIDDVKNSIIFKKTDNNN